MEEKKPTIQSAPVEEIKPLNKELPVGSPNFNQQDDLAWTKTELMKGMKIKQPLASAPTYDPKNFFEQVAFYNNKPYFNINNTWYTQTDGEYEAGVIQRTSGATGNLTVTCGFQPKMVEIIANGASLNDGYSTGVYTPASGNNCLYNYFTSPNWNTTSSASFSFVIIQADTDQSYGTVASVSSTGFVINFGGVTETINLIWKAYA